MGGIQEKINVKIITDNDNKQFNFVCLNKTSPEPSFLDGCCDGGNYLMSDETIKSLEKLGLVLKEIHDGMKNSGYEIKDGIIIKTDESKQK